MQDQEEFNVEIRSQYRRIQMVMGPSAQILFSAVPPSCYICGSALVSGEPMYFLPDGSQAQIPGLYDLVHVPCGDDPDGSWLDDEG